MTTNELDLYEICEDLEDAASLCEDELGQWWGALAALHPRVVDGGTTEFFEQYEKQLRYEHQRLKEDFRIVEREHTYTRTCRELKHYSE